MRRVIQAAFLLFLGAVTSWAVAWACAAWSDPEQGRPALAVQDAGTNQRLVTCRRSAFGHTRIDQCVFSDLQLDASSGDILLARAEPDGSERSASLAGWPWRCLECTNYAEITIRGPNSMMGINKTGWGAVPNGIELSAFSNPATGSRWRALPCQPRWAQLALDTMLFAAVGWALAFGGSLIRRQVRRRRGQCPWCAYPIGVSLACTECGKPVNPKQAT